MAWSKERSKPSGLDQRLCAGLIKRRLWCRTQKLSDTAVTNFTEMTYRRIYWHIGVEYRTSIEQLSEIREKIAAHIAEDGDFVDAKDASTFVRIDKFGASSIDILVYCFTKDDTLG